MTERKGTFLFVVAPNLGIVDSWLPVLAELKDRHPRLKFVALYPQHHVLAQTRPMDLLTEFSAELFGSVIYESAEGDWLLSNTFREAANLQPAMPRPPWLSRLARHAQHALWHRSNPVRTPERTTIEGVQNELSDVEAVLFDIAQEKREIVRLLQEGACRNAHWFSLPHGLDLRTSHLDNKLKLEKPINDKRLVKVTAYTLSDTEVDSYQRAYGLERHAIRPVGIPRHASAWVARVHRRFEGEALPRTPYVFLVSRPKSSKYLPLDRKIQALRDIKQLSDELNFDLVIRRHPNEHEDELFLETLGRRGYGSKWSFSTLHPFVLGSRALFCITFFSSVAVDMAAIGVPVVERCDFSGLEATQFERDSRGRVTSLYQNLGVALGAASYEELKKHALRIIADREMAAASGRNAYKLFYTTVDDPSGLIADDIEKSLWPGVDAVVEFPSHA